jgi:hypothetical protein
MEKIIASCGINCASCDARIATINNDNELRKATAEKWSVVFHAPGLTYEMINCTGCREEGPKFSHCSDCEIRNCVKAKGFSTCGDCAEIDTCTIVGAIFNIVPDAKSNLLGLNL